MNKWIVQDTQPVGAFIASPGRWKVTRNRHVGTVADYFQDRAAAYAEAARRNDADTVKLMLKPGENSSAHEEWKKKAANHLP